jgi:Fe-S cluster assembly ATP-binding protein
MNDNKVMVEIQDLHVNIENKEILKGINLSLQGGSLHVIMGPNGSGKSTLANTIMGHPKYKASQGTIKMNENDLLSLTPDKRAKMGVFLAFQYPVEVPGLSLSKLIWSAQSAIGINKTMKEFQDMLLEGLKIIDLDNSFSSRSVNEGLSGGEKKRCEMLQAYMLRAKFVILDEIDSGLDVDALKHVSNMINWFVKNNSTVLLITHYQRILEHLSIDKVHIISDGRIVDSGDYGLVKKIEQEGYERYKKVM